VVLALDCPRGVEPKSGGHSARAGAYGGARSADADAGFVLVLHTVNPLDGNPRELYAEAAVGLGETLASGAMRGNPYRFVCDKECGTLRMLAFANFSQALRPAAAGGVSRETVDYSRIPLSCDAEARKELGARLARIGGRVEEAFDGPQDIEGAVVGKELYLVQARAQQGARIKYEV